MNRFWEADGRSAGQKILRFFPLQNQTSLEVSQQRNIIPYPVPAVSTLHPHAPLHNTKIYVNIIIPSLHKGPLRFVYYLQVS